MHSLRWDPHSPTLSSMQEGPGIRPTAGRFVAMFSIALAASLLWVLPVAATSIQQFPDGAIIFPPERVEDPMVRRAWADLLIEPQDQAYESVIVVSGQGTVEVEPDRARIFFAVETERSTAREAGEGNAERMTAVTAAVRTAGASAAGLRVETSSYSLNPVYSPTRQNRPREIVGYTARNALVVTVDDVDMVGALIDAALGAGSNRVTSLQFDVRDSEPYRSEALRQAIRTARAEADVMAETLGMILGAPIEVQGGAEVPIPRPLFQSGPDRAMAMAEAVPTPIEAGLQRISASVTIRFRLLPTP